MKGETRISSTGVKFQIYNRDDLTEEEQLKKYKRKLKSKHICKRCGFSFYDYNTKTIKDDFCRQCIEEAIFLLQKNDNKGD